MKIGPRLAVVLLVLAVLSVGNASVTNCYFVSQKVSHNNVLQAINNWYDLIWHWRVPISINNGGSVLSNYQLRLTVNTAALVVAGKLQPAGNDIRFTGGDGLVSLNYWIDSGMNTASTVIWVKVPSIPAGSSIIYMYYGNPLAEAASSGNNTFYFFDDFESGFAPGVKWTVLNPTAGTISLSTTSAFQGTNSLRVTDSPGGYNLGLYTAFPLQTQCVVEYAIYFNVQGSKAVQVQDLDGNIGPSGAFVKSKAGSDTIEYYVTDWTTIGTFRAGDWYQMRLVIKDTTTAIDYYDLYFYNSAGGLLAQANNVRFANNTDLSSIGRFTYIGTSDVRTDTYLDMVRVRAYAAVEPTYSIGGEQ